MKKLAAPIQYKFKNTDYLRFRDIFLSWNFRTMHYKFPEIETKLSYILWLIRAYF